MTFSLEKKWLIEVYKITQWTEGASSPSSILLESEDIGYRTDRKKDSISNHEIHYQWKNVDSKGHKNIWLQKGVRYIHGG